MQKELIKLMSQMTGQLQLRNRLSKIDRGYQSTGADEKSRAAQFNRYDEI
jgi:hypothetical protein